MHIYVRTLMLCTCMIQICHGMDEQPQILSSITAITSFDQAANVLDAADKNTLVLFDVDETLTTDQDPRLYKSMMQTNAHLDSLYLQGEEPLLVESSVVQLIQDLQKRNVKVLGLTAMHTGPYGAMTSWTEWRYAKLKAVDIDFNTGDFNNMTFKTIRQAENRRHPCLHNGIICTNALNKGTVLSIFLNTIDWNPSKIIFFDDKLSFLDHVSKALVSRSIHFHGFHYCGVQNLERNIDPRLTHLRFEHMVRTRRYISQEDAQQLLTNDTQPEPTNTVSEPVKQKTVSQPQGSNAWRQLLSKYCCCCPVVQNILRRWIISSANGSHSVPDSQQ